MAAPREDESQDSGQVSETSQLDPEETQPIAPEDATAGYPESESGAPDEGTAGTDAPPRDGRPDSADE